VSCVEPIVGTWQVIANGNYISLNVISETNGVLDATFGGDTATGYWSATQQKVTFIRDDWQVYVGYLYYVESESRVGKFNLFTTTTYLSGYFDIWYEDDYHRFAWYATKTTAVPSATVEPIAIDEDDYENEAWNFYTNNTVGTLTIVCAGLEVFSPSALLGTVTGSVTQILDGTEYTVALQTGYWDSEDGTLTLWAAESGLSTETIYHGYLMEYSQTVDDQPTYYTIITGYYLSFEGSPDVTEFGWHAIYTYTPVITTK